MTTINVSLPESLAEKVELLLAQKEYASRSEVIRTALRVFFTLEAREETVELLPFVKRPLNEVKAELLEAGQKPEFVESVVSGLKKSSVYQK